MRGVFNAVKTATGHGLSAQQYLSNLFDFNNWRGDMLPWRILEIA